MKNQITAFRQGDVVVTPVDIEIKGLKKLPHTILALGEVTGHKHAAVCDNPNTAVLYDIPREELEAVCKQFLPDYRWKELPDGSVRLLEITEKAKGAKITHDEHSEVALKPGKYIINIQQQYEPGAVRQVAD